jgi:hypothetical protein
MLSIRRVRGRDETALMNHGDGGKVELIRVGRMRSFGLVEGAQILNVDPAGPAECEGRWGTALGASGGLPPRHPVAVRLNSDLAPGAALRSSRHSPSADRKAAGWPPGPGHDATRPAGSAGSPMSKREWHRVHPKLDCSCF